MENWYKSEFKNRIFAEQVVTLKPESRIFLCGWAFRFRDQGGVIFIDLRDRSGIVQIVARKEIVERRYQKEEKEDNDENKDHDEENEIILYERMKKIEIIVLISIIVLLNLFYVFFL